MLANEIGLKLTTYTLRDPASDKLRILMATEIDRTANPDGRLALAYSLVDEQRAPRSTARSIARSRRRSRRTAMQRYTGFILSDATGMHTLKIAVIDEAGRRGSVEHSFRASLTPLGEVRATDILIADERTGTGSAAPAVGNDFTSGMATGYIELYSDADRSPEKHQRHVRGGAGRAGASARRRRRQSATGDGRRAEQARARGNDSARASAAW